MKQKTWMITWLPGEVASSGADVRGSAVLGVDLPTSMQGTTLAVQAAIDAYGNAGPYRPLVDAKGLALTMVVSPGARIALAPGVLQGHGWIRLVSDVAQSAQRGAILVGAGDWQG